jgi:hypothetical protein
MSSCPATSGELFYMKLSALKEKLRLKSMNRKRKPRVEILPKHLKSKTARLELVRKVVNADLTQAEREVEAKAITKRVRHDAWNWTTGLDQAAYLVAEDRMTLKDIEEKTLISTSRIKKMISLNGEFCKRVDHYREEWMKKLKTKSTANRDLRINIYAEMADKLVGIYRDRAKQYKNKKHPGVNSGMMVRTIKAVGHGPKAKFIRGWEVDHALSREIRDTLQQMAKERGEWTEKTENSNTVLVREYQGVNTADV